MSNFLNFAGNQGVTFKDHGTGGGTSFTGLAHAASTNSVLLTVGGILQSPGVDYTVSGTTITTTSSVTSGVEVLSYIVHKPGTAPTIQDNSISNAKMLDDAVGLAELSATGTPSSSNFLRGDNAWAEVGGGFTLTAEQATTSGSTVTFGSIPSGVKMIIIMAEGFSDSPSGGNPFLIRIGDAGGIESSGYVSGGNYDQGTIGRTTSTSGYVVNNPGSARIAQMMWILTLKDASNYTWACMNVGSNEQGDAYSGMGHKSLSAELTQVQIALSSGAFDAGSASVLYM